MPLLASIDPFRAWILGLGLAVLSSLLLFVPLGLGLYLAPLTVGGLVIYSLTVRPRAFAASGVLLGTSPTLAWGVIDGLEKCARFNRAPGGGCEADPTTQLVIAATVYGAALLVTAIAARQARRLR